MNMKITKTTIEERGRRAPGPAAWARGLALLVLFAYMTLLVIAPSTSLMAEEAAGAPNQENLSVVLLADTSGSMRDNDPNNLRYNSLRAFIDMLGAEDYLSLITFDTEVQKVWPLTRLGDSASRTPLKDQLNTALEAGGYSDYLSAFRMARGELEARPEGTKPIIVVLTDGEPLPGGLDFDNAEVKNNYIAQLMTEVDALAQSGTPIYSVGFSTDVDRAVLDDMAVRTKGEVNLLDSPVDLELALFQDIRTIKNRTLVLEEKRTLRATDEPQTVRLDMDPFTRQIKLLLTHPGVQNFTLETQAPDGVDGASNSYLIRQDEYSLFVIEPKAGSAAGTWRVRLSGEGNISLFADKDLHTKPFILSPAAHTLQPSGESMEVVLELRNEEGKLALDPANYLMEAILELPDGITQPITLQEDAGSYRAVVETLTTLGEYKLVAKLSTKGQLIAQSEAIFQVRDLPTVTLDLKTDGQVYKLNSDPLVSARLLRADVAMQPGPELELSRFELVLIHEDAGIGEETSYAFVNDGTGGDAKAGDELWAARPGFSQAGNSRVVVELEGRYQGAAFVTTRELGTIEIAPPGTILLEATSATWLLGQTNRLTVTLTNQSPFRQEVQLRATGLPVTLGEDRVVLEPEQVLTRDFVFSTLDGVTAGNAELRLEALPSDTAVTVENQNLPVALVVTNSTELAQKTFQETLQQYGPFIALTPLLILLYIAGGYLLYLRKLKPSRMLKGELVLRRAGGTPHITGPKRNASLIRTTDDLVTIPLHRLDKHDLRFSLGEAKDADFQAADSAYQFILVIERISLPIKHPILAGWGALKQSPPESSDVLVKAEAPGVIQSEGKISSQKIMHPGDSWQAGDLEFTYTASQDEDNQGKDLLEGRV